MISLDTVAVLQSILLLLGCALLAMLSVLGLAWMGRHRTHLMHVPITVWRDAILLRIVVFVALFVGDLLIVNPGAPAWMVSDSGGSIQAFISHLSNWDGRWYIGIAEMGYNELTREDIEDRQGQWRAAPLEVSSRWAASAPEQWKYYGPYHFLPLFPMLLRMFLQLPLSSPMVGVIVSNLLFILCVAGLYRLAERHGERVAADAVRLYCLMPGSIFTFGAFSEPLFVALAAWTLVFAERNKRSLSWLGATLVATTRISGILVSTSLMVKELVVPRADKLAVRFGRALVQGLPGLVGLGLVAIYFKMTSGEPFPFVKAQVLGGYGLSLPWEVARQDLHTPFGGVILLPLWVALLLLVVRGISCLPIEETAMVLPIFVLHSVHKHSSLLRFTLELFPVLIVLSVWITRSERIRLFTYSCLACSTGLLGALFVNGIWVG